jgi:hypothetical protein
VLVTDHHSPRADGVAARRAYVHPALCAYPCPRALRHRGSNEARAGAARVGRASTRASERDDLELVALATVADVVPLRGENRRLVRAGLRALARTRAGPAGADERSRRSRRCALDERRSRSARAADQRRRAPLPRRRRARAAAHRRSARAASSRRSSIGCNAERRTSKRGSASKPRRWSRRGRPSRRPTCSRAAGWHPGVIGIVAARIAERHHRPVVLVALPERGRRPGSGSARSIPGLRPARRPGRRRRAPRALRRPPRRGRPDDRPAAAVDAFRGAFVAHAEAALGPEQLRRLRARRRDRDRARRSASSSRRSSRGWRRSAPATRRSRCCSRRRPSATPSASAASGATTTRASRQLRRRPRPRGRVRVGHARRGRAGQRRSMPPSRSSATNGRASSSRGCCCAPPRLRPAGDRAARRGRGLPRAGARGARPPARPAPARGGGAGPQLEIDRRGRGIAALITRAARDRRARARAGADAPDAPSPPRRAPRRLRALPRGARARAGAGGPFAHVVALDPPSARAAQLRARGGRDRRDRTVIWRGDRLSYALLHTYTSRSTVSATRSPPATGRSATGAARPAGSSRRSCVRRRRHRRARGARAADPHGGRSRRSRPSAIRGWSP